MTFVKKSFRKLLNWLRVQGVRHNPSQVAKANGIDLVYDSFGKPRDAPLLLIASFGEQMIAWHEEFCTRLAARGYWVIRFDNRDAGLSSKMNNSDVSDTAGLASVFAKGMFVAAPYTLKEMADDTAGLLDTLEIQSAHIVGISMGGMIAQMMAIRHGKRVRTLTSMLSTTGDSMLPSPTQEALKVLLTPAPVDRAGYVEHCIRSWRVLEGPAFPLDEARAREYAERSYDRGLARAGTARQMRAVMASGSRKQALKGVTVPTLVIHGDADPLVPLAGGMDTANAIPGAKLLVIEGMGHTLSVAAWPRIISAIAEHAI
ncbi:MAG: alpha/beta fold hydrolase [Burkholderiales bacterium]